MKLLTALLLLASLNGRAQDRTVYFPEVREHYNIYHPMIIKDTSKTIWVDSLTMLKMKGSWKVVDSFKNHTYNIWPKMVAMGYTGDEPNIASWWELYKQPCGATIRVTGKNKIRAQTNFSKHCSVCKEVFNDIVYYTYRGNLTIDKNHSIIK